MSPRALPAHPEPPASDAHAERAWEYSAFPVTVARARAVSPAWMRITVTGEALQHFAPWGLDQRIKLVLPLPGGGLADFGLLEEPTPHPSHWYTRWKQLPEGDRNVLRTYTPAAIRPQTRELDIDVLLHDPPGPASRWARSARPGDDLVITGPDARAGWTGYGLHWKPERPVERALLIGDETAFPAIRGILASLPRGARADVLLELADPRDDLVSPTAPAGARILRGLRDGAVPGRRLEELVHGWTAEHGDGTAQDPGLSVWIAGETGAVARIRAHLTQDAGIPKAQVAFLGYWRIGGSLVG